MAKKDNGCYMGARFSKDIKDLAIKVAKNQGMTFSSWLRHLVMTELADLSYLPEENKKALGIK